jgi:hypothetical protein
MTEKRSRNRLARLARLVRLSHPSAWRFLLLTATDPALDKLYALLRNERLPKILDAPYPRFAIAAVEYVAPRVRPGFRILEWGAGSSTLWFASKGASVLSIEHDPLWQRLTGLRLPDPSVVLQRELGPEYWRPVESIQEFDLIVIDGRRRHECAGFVLEQVHARRHRAGMTLLFDDSQRTRYGECLEALAGAADWMWTYSGTSGVVLDKTTTLFRFD